MTVLPVVPKTTKGFTGCTISNQGLYRLRHKQPRVLPVVPETTKGVPVSKSRSPGNGVVRGGCQQWCPCDPAWAFGPAGDRPVPREGCNATGPFRAQSCYCINPQLSCNASARSKLAICQSSRIEKRKRSRSFFRGLDGSVGFAVVRWRACRRKVWAWRKRSRQYSFLQCCRRRGKRSQILQKPLWRGGCRPGDLVGPCVPVWTCESAGERLVTRERCDSDGTVQPRSCCCKHHYVTGTVQAFATGSRLLCQNTVSTVKVWRQGGSCIAGCRRNGRRNVGGTAGDSVRFAVTRWPGCRRNDGVLRVRGRQESGLQWCRRRGKRSQIVKKSFGRGGCRPGDFVGQCIRTSGKRAHVLTCPYRRGGPRRRYGERGRQNFVLQWFRRRGKRSQILKNRFRQGGCRPGNLVGQCCRTNRKRADVLTCSYRRSGPRRRYGVGVARFLERSRRGVACDRWCRSARCTGGCLRGCRATHRKRGSLSKPSCLCARGSGDGLTGSKSRQAARSLTTRRRRFAWKGTMQGAGDTVVVPTSSKRPAFYCPSQRWKSPVSR